jgi:hypothetical protein
MIKLKNIFYAVQLIFGKLLVPCVVCVCVLQVSDELIYANYVQSNEQFVHYL